MSTTRHGRPSTVLTSLTFLTFLTASPAVFATADALITKSLLIELDADTVPSGIARVEFGEGRTEPDGTHWEFIAGGYADDTSGAIGAGFVASVVGPGRGVVPQVVGQVFDTMHVFGPGTAVVEFSYSVIGSASAFNGSGMRATGSLDLGGGDGGFVEFTWVEGWSIDGVRVRNVGGDLEVASAIPESMIATMRFRKTVESGATIPVFASLEITGGTAENDTLTVAFDHTGQIGVAMPEGWSFTSETGTFLSLAPLPPAPIPEPASVALFATGLGALAWQTRRRVRGRPEQAALRARRGRRSR